MSSSTYLPSSVLATLNKVQQPLQPVTVSPLIFGMDGGRSRTRSTENTRGRSSPVGHCRESEIIFAEVVFLVRKLSLIYQTLHLQQR